MIQANTSSTFDEPFYLSCARRTIAESKIDDRFVTRGVAPLPILVTYVPAIVLFESRAETIAAARLDAVVDDPGIIRIARMIHTGLVGTAFALLPYLWIRSRFGSCAATICGLMVCFSPSIIAHCALATTDAMAALSGLMAVLASIAYFERASRVRAVIVGVACAIALSVKYSGALFIVCGACIVFIAPFNQSSKTLPSRFAVKLRTAMCNLALFLSVSCVGAWLIHGFRITNVSDPMGWRGLANAPEWFSTLGRSGLPEPCAGICAQIVHNQRGHPAYLFGERSSEGWWWYFPATLALKSTPSDVLLAVFCIVTSIALGQKSRARNGRKQETVLCLTSIAFLLAAATLCNVNIGQRYLLIVYPLWFLAWSACAAAGCARSRWIMFGYTLIVLSQIVTAIHTLPNNLAYFTPIVGGSKEGHLYLADSNIDWGQDLPSLRRVQVGSFPNRRLALLYFGRGEPVAYGVEAISLTQAGNGFLDNIDLVAVSVTILHRVYFSPGTSAEISGVSKLCEVLARFPPKARAGYSIFIYDLGDPKLREALRNVKIEVSTDN